MILEKTGILLLAGALLALAPGQIEAQTYAPVEKVAISGTEYEQTAAHDNNTSTTTAAPKKVSISASTLLAQLVADEYAYGQNKSFTSAKVPSGAVLKFYGTGFEIDQGATQLADVSADGFLAWSISGQNDINDGTYLDSVGPTAPPYNQVNYFLATITYTSPPASTNPLFLTVQGLATVTTKATTPNRSSGKYTLSASVSFSDGTGEGDYGALEFVVTGFTMTGSGSMTLTNN